MPLLLRSLTDRSRVSTATAWGTVRSAVRWGHDHGLASLAMGRAARSGDVQGRLVAGGGQMTPDQVGELAAEARGSGVLHRGTFGMVTATVDGVREVLGSNDFRTGVFEPGPGLLGSVRRWAEDGPAFGPITRPSLLVTEPPDHTRYRKLVTRVFSARAVESLRERTQLIADGLLDGLDPERPIDLVEAYCAQLPVTVIAEILGVPPEDRALVLELGTAAAPSLDLGLTWREHRDTEAGLARFDTWLDQHLDRLRRQPGDDLMSQLVAVRDEGRGLDETELKATAGLVLAAGFETTVNLLGNAVALLVTHPDQLRRLQTEPDLWANAVDEVLRIDPPVLLTGRVAARDTEVAGQAVSRGSLVTTLLAGANRDPDVFSDPDRFDVARENARDHVSFSSGRHYCLGAALARMEGEVGLRSLFERFPGLQLEPGAVRRPTRILRGYQRLPARLTGPPTGSGTNAG